MRIDNDNDVFMSEVYQLRDDFRDLGEVVPTKRLTTIILNALCFETKFDHSSQASRYHYFSLEAIQKVIKTLFISHSESRRSPKGVKSLIVKMAESQLCNRRNLSPLQKNR